MIRKRRRHRGVTRKAKDIWARGRVATHKARRKRHPHPWYLRHLVGAQALLAGASRRGDRRSRREVRAELAQLEKLDRKLARQSRKPIANEEHVRNVYRALREKLGRS